MSTCRSLRCRFWTFSNGFMSQKFGWKARKTDRRLSLHPGMDCYNSSDPAAVNATIVYDFHVHHRDFWSRNIEDVQDQPLLHCSSTDLPRETQCTVCLDHVVYAVCRKLKDRVVLTMEALQHPIKISKSDCPKLLSDASPQWLLFVAIALLVLVLLIFAVCFYQRQKGRKTQTPQEADAQQEELL